MNINILKALCVLLCCGFSLESLAITCINNQPQQYGFHHHLFYTTATEYWNTDMNGMWSNLNEVGLGSHQSSWAIGEPKEFPTPTHNWMISPAISGDVFVSDGMMVRGWNGQPQGTVTDYDEDTRPAEPCVSATQD